MTAVAEFESSIDDILPGLAGLAKNVSVATGAFRSLASSLGAVPAPLTGNESALATRADRNPADAEADGSVDARLATSRTQPASANAAPPARNAVADAALGAAGAPGRMIGAIASGDPTQMLASAVGELVQRSKPLQYVVKQLDDFMSSLANSLTSFLEPFMPLVFIVGKVGAAVGELVGSFLTLTVSATGLEAAVPALFEGIKFIGGVIAAAAAGINWVATFVRNEIFKFVSETLKKVNVGGAFDGLIKAMDEQVKPLGSLTETVSAAFNEFTKVTLADAQNDFEKFGKDIEDTGASLLNLPSYVDIAAARFDVGGPPGGELATSRTTSAPIDDSGRGSQNGSTPMQEARPGGDTYIINFYAAVNLEGDGGFKSFVKQQAARARREGGRTTGSSAGGRQSNGPNGISGLDSNPNI